jgi:peptide/nickel transport system substrate-binding protein
MARLTNFGFWRPAGLAVVAALLLAACGGASPAKPAAGGTVTFAEGADAAPNYIAPLMPGAYFSVSNITDFTKNMYLPLYWFGNKGEPKLRESLSLAKTPVFSNNNTEVTVTLKHWEWSNGQPITARDVIFWVNLLSAVTDPKAPTIGSTSAPGPGWGAAVPGGFPQNVVSYSATGTYTVVFKLNGSYSPTWYLYNELSQIYPMPQKSWDELSASGPVGNYDVSAETRTTLANTTPTEYVPANPGTATSGALGVAQFINKQSQDLSTYSTNPLWQVADGPFKLSQFTPSGFAKLVPNKNYSGSPKPTISAFEEEPFTSDTAEFNALRSGNLTIGYVPVQDLNQRATLEKSEGYKYNPWFDFGIVYFPYNFTNSTVGPIFKQLYFRQAFQSLVNQKQYIKDFAGGIGSINNGPVPGYPAHNVDESSLEANGEVYSYDASKAVSLLKDNGWTVSPGGTSYCSKAGTAAGDCGANIKAQQPANFTMLYASGNTELTSEMEAMQSTMKSVAGIDLTLSQAPFSQVIGVTFNGCTNSHACNGWELASWGGGWVYGINPLPTGEELFETGAGSNAGDYSNATNDSNIKVTNTASSLSAEFTALFKYENFLAKQLPVAWMPNAPYQLTMYKSDLKGVVPQGVYDEIYPAFYRLKH